MACAHASSILKGMYKELLQHTAYVEAELHRTLPVTEREHLAAYHNRRVRDFQHERLIHLLVTFFFGLLLLISIAALCVAPADALLPLGVLSALLLMLELAYIRHYYQLENGVQSLYKLSEQLGTSSF